jgi:hypothetical protein
MLVKNVKGVFAKEAFLPVIKKQKTKNIKKKENCSKSKVGHYVRARNMGKDLLYGRSRERERREGQN